MLSKKTSDNCQYSECTPEQNKKRRVWFTSHRQIRNMGHMRVKALRPGTRGGKLQNEIAEKRTSGHEMGCIVWTNAAWTLDFGHETLHMRPYKWDFVHVTLYMKLYTWGLRHEIWCMRLHAKHRSETLDMRLYIWDIGEALDVYGSFDVILHAWDFIHDTLCMTLRIRYTWNFTYENVARPWTWDFMHETSLVKL
jgi:hypothetical protein